MRVIPYLLTLLTGAARLPADDKPPTPAQAPALLEEALTLAQSVPDRAERADAVGLVAAELAKSDPKRALELLKGELGTHEQSLAMASAAESLAQHNRLLGLATLLRIGDVSTMMVALTDIVAVEALTDLDEALKITDHIEPLTVQQMVEREVTRVIWADIPGDRAAAVDVAVKWARTISDPVTRYEALAYAAEGAATVDLARGQEVAQSIPDTEPRDLALRLVTEHLAASDPAAAQNLLGAIQTPLQRNLAAVAVVAGLGKAGRGDEAGRLAAAVRKSVDADLENPLERGEVLEPLAIAIVDREPTTALSIASEVWPPARRLALQCRLATSKAHKDPSLRRELIRDAWLEVRRNDSPLIQRQIASAALASAALVAPELLDEMVRERPELVQASLPAAVRSLAAEHAETALALIGRMEDARAAEQAKAALVAAVVGTNPEVARGIADTLALPGPKSAALVALAAGGDRAR